MATHGTPLEDFDVVELVGVLMTGAARSGVVKDRETLKYWKGRTGDLASLLREVMLKPGCRVLEINREAHLPMFDDYERVAWDTEASELHDVDLSKVRFIPLNKLNPRKHIVLDEMVAQLFLERLDVLPRGLLQVNCRVAFVGSTFELRQPTQEQTSSFNPHLAVYEDARPQAVMPESAGPNCLVAVMLRD